MGDGGAPGGDFPPGSLLKPCFFSMCLPLQGADANRNKPFSLSAVLLLLFTIVGTRGSTRVRRVCPCLEHLSGVLLLVLLNYLPLGKSLPV